MPELFTEDPRVCLRSLHLHLVCVQAVARRARLKAAVDLNSKNPEQINVLLK